MSEKIFLSSFPDQKAKACHLSIYNSPKIMQTTVPLSTVETTGFLDFL